MLLICASFRIIKTKSPAFIYGESSSNKIGEDQESVEHVGDEQFSRDLVEGIKL